jgi:hypothetical protein
MKTQRPDASTALREIEPPPVTRRREPVSLQRPHSGRQNLYIEQGWLCTWLQGMRRIPVGSQGPIWTLPPRDALNRKILRRKDGSPHEPKWRPGDIAAVYHPVSERCIAVLEISGLPDWRADEELWFTMTVVLAEDADGPQLATLGLEAPKQGGRERILDKQLDAVLDAFNLEWTYGVQAYDTVRYRMLPDGVETTRRIVPTSQLRVANGDITEASPIGSALIKARVGDVVRVVLPAGVRSLEVLAVDSPAE